MNIVSTIKKLIASLFNSSKSVDSILKQHRETIDALNVRSAAMTEQSSQHENEIEAIKKKLDEAISERKRADSIATAMNKVFAVDVG